MSRARRALGSASRAAGFTLVEVTVSLLILALMVTFVYQILWNAVATRNAISEGLEAPKVDNAIFDQIARDFRYLYYQAGQFPADAGFWGRQKSINGMDADRVDFVTARTSRIAELEDANTGETPGDSPLTEIGYACRISDANNLWLELWRREDYFVDDDPTDGGKFSLVYDKVRRFSLRYYPLSEENTTEEGLAEWDSKTMHKVPYAVILDLQYDLHEPTKEEKEPQARVTKILLLRPARSLDPDAAMGMDSSGGMR